MKFREIQEACWSGYKQQGMKKKGNRMVPKCVPVSEVKTGPEMTLNDLLYTAAAKAMHQAGLEGVPMDYEEAIKKAAKIYRIPYTPSELPRLLAQRAEIDRRLAMLKQGKQVAKARRKEKLAPTPAGSEEWFKTHSPTADRIKPPTRTLEETEAELAEDLKKWFKEKWVRFGPDGRIRGDCARGSKGEGKPKCLPQAKAHALGKKGRASAAAKKRREDPNPERRGPARNVATKVKEDANPKFAALIKNIQARMKKDDYQRPEIIKRVAQMVQQADPTVPDAMATARELVQQHGQGPVVKQTNVWDLKAQARSGNLAAQLPKTSAGTPSYAQQHATFEEQSTNNDDWYDDADEFGMPGSEFFSDDDRLRDGDYVRDRQDGEYGEIFRMSGDPSERRVRILDRDGKGWYISPERLVAVDRNDPDIMKYFGKRRHRDMDEAEAKTYYRVIHNGKPIDVLIDTMQQAQMIAQKLEQKYGGKARVDHTVNVPKALDEGVIDAFKNWRQHLAMIIGGPKKIDLATVQLMAMQELDKVVADGSETSRLLKPFIDSLKDAIRKSQSRAEVGQIASRIGKDLPQVVDQIRLKRLYDINPEAYHQEIIRRQNTDKDQLKEKQDACYRKVKSRYKVWPSAYASGALVQCRKKGAANWGNKSKK